jgi:hypothetical protein
MLLLMKKGTGRLGIRDTSVTIADRKGRRVGMEDREVRITDYKTQAHPKGDFDIYRYEREHETARTLRAELEKVKEELDKYKAIGGELSEEGTTDRLMKALAASQQQVADWQNKWLGENAAWKAVTLDYQTSQQELAKVKGGLASRFFAEADRQVKELEQQNGRLREAWLFEHTERIRAEERLKMAQSMHKVQCQVCEEAALQESGKGQG